MSNVSKLIKILLYTCICKFTYKNDRDLDTSIILVCWENLGVCYAPVMTMAGALSVNPVHLSKSTYIKSSQIVLIRILLNLFTLFSTIMSSSRR